MDDEPKLWEYFFGSLCCASKKQNEVKPKKSGKKSNDKDYHLEEDDSHFSKQSKGSAKTQTLTLVDISEENENQNNFEKIFTEANTLPYTNKKDETNLFSFKQSIDNSVIVKQMSEIENELKFIQAEIEVLQNECVLEKKQHYQSALKELKEKINKIPDDRDLEMNKINLSIAIDICWQELLCKLSSEKQSQQSIKSIKEINRIAAECDAIWSQVEGVQNEISETDHVFYDEMFTRLLLKLDYLDLVDQPEVREMRRDLIRRIKEKIEALSRLVKH